MPSSGIDLDQTPVSPSEAQAALVAILRSPQFERSERLQRFLRFICELTLTGESHRINEYLIGSEVFHRGSDYSPSEDSIVRRQAHTLRQKLQEYYAGEGQNDPIRIELPVGRYVPLFRRSPAVAPEVVAPASLVSEPQPDAVAPTAAPAIASPELQRPSRKWAYATGALVAGVLVGFLLRPVGSAKGTVPIPEPATTEIWSPWFQASGDAVICFSNPLTAVVKHFAKPLPPDTQPPRYRLHPEDEKRMIDAFHLAPSDFVYYAPAINQTKVGEAIAGVHLTTLLAKHGVQVRTTQSRFLSWEALRKDNLILMGHSEANQWLEPLLKEYPFRLVVTTDEHPRGIINVKPARGEPAEYKIAYSQSENEADREYALVSMIPGVDRSRRLLLINGLNSQATQIATEYMTSENTLNQLLGRLKTAAPRHTGPWYFQVVMRTEVYDKVPVRANLEAVRVLDVPVR